MSAPQQQAAPSAAASSLLAGTFLIAFSALALEVTLTRLLSVTTWYSLAFFVIGTAMLGLTAGATRVYLRPERFAGELLPAAMARACLAYSVATPLSLLVLCVTPIGLWVDPLAFVLSLVATAACAAPFYFAGVAITAALTRTGLAPGFIYAADLLGASGGCLLVLGALELLDAPTLILVCGGVGALAALEFGNETPHFGRRRAMLWLGVSVLLVIGNMLLPTGIRPLVVKGRVEPPGAALIERWNSFSRVMVYPREISEPLIWGPSPTAPSGRRIPRYVMNIDGEAATAVGRFRSSRDVEYLRHDVVNLAHYLRPRGPVCVIGVGGGRDIQAALEFGHERIVGVEINPLFVELLEGPFAEFAGLAGRDEVRLVVDEARSWLARSTQRFALIQMSLIDTWAATGAGAHTLSENALYTVEAWHTVLDRLRDDGFFTVSRWYHPADLGETGRLLSLAVATLLERDVIDPSLNVAMAAAPPVSTLIVSPRSFSQADRERLEYVVDHLGFELVAAPGRPPQHPLLRRILAARSPAELRAATADEVVDYTPPTDERPYFFNMLRLSHLSGWADPGRGVGIVAGNQLAIGTLIALVLCLALLCVLTILVPLWRRARAEGDTPPVLRSGALFFALIGGGFMFAEIGLLQRLSVFLGHPVYALGILLFTLIASTGLGSAASERVALTRRRALVGLPLVAAAVLLALRLALPPLVHALVREPAGVRIAASIAAIAPLGFVLGGFFPTGMRLARATRPDEAAWYWALNGITGVLCSALAVFCAIFAGISRNLELAAVCYALCAPCLLRLAAHHDAREGGSRRPQ